jgi:hypothetical protein
MEKEVVIKENIRSLKTHQKTKVSRPPFHSSGELLRYEYYKPTKEMEKLDEENYLDNLERQHKASLPKFDLRWQIETFPEAKSIIVQKLQEEVALCEKDIAEAERLESYCDDLIYRKSPKKDEEFWHALVEVLYLNPLRLEQRKILKRDLMYLSMFEGKSSTSNPLSVTPAEIAKAKDYPVTDLIDFGRKNSNTAICPFHTEKTGSLHYYPKTNTCHCFGACGKTFDSIEVYKKLNNCSFVEAVRKLQ